MFTQLKNVLYKIKQHNTQQNCNGIEKSGKTELKLIAVYTEIQTSDLNT